MNERDIKQFFAGASLSEQKKTQLKETLKKRFPQQNGDINTDTFTPQTEPTQPAIVARHKGAKVVAAAAAVALVMSGGIYMTRNIHDYEPNAGTAPPANSSVSGDTGTLQLCSADFIKLADTVLESANSTVGNLDIIQNSPAYCDIEIGRASCRERV